MNILICSLLISVCSLDFLFTKIGIVNRYIALLPDLFSIIAMLVIIFRLASKKPLFIQPKYVIFFSIIFLHIVIGIVLNSVPSGAIFAGIRTYFRYLPFFLLPFIYSFTDDEVKLQVKIFLGIALLQFPVTIYQRFIQYKGIATGDVITGTVTVSSELSILLISVIAVIYGFYLKKGIKSWFFYLVLPFLFFPMTLNETKGTLILLPIALLVPTLLLAITQKKISTLVITGLIGGILVSGFVIFYDLSLGTNTERSVIGFFSEGRFYNYLYTEAKGEEWEGTYDVGRIDSIVLAFKKLSSDFTKLALGLGIGNVSLSFSSVLAGEYTYKYAYMFPTRTAVSILLWEIGIIGLILVIIGYFLIFMDSLFVSREDNIAGGLALGWSGVIVICFVSLLYKNFISWNSISYPFWYFSGYIAAKAVQHTMIARSSQLQHEMLSANTHIEKYL